MECVNSLIKGADGCFECGNLCSAGVDDVGNKMSQENLSKLTSSWGFGKPCTPSVQPRVAMHVPCSILHYGHFSLNRFYIYDCF